MRIISVACLLLLLCVGCARVPYRVGFPQRDSVRAEAGEYNTAAHYNTMGVNHELAGQYEKAIQAYRKSLDLESGNQMARANLGNALAKVGRFDEAEKCYRDVLSDDPENLAAMNNLAWLLASTGDERDCEEAIVLATRCLSLAAQAAPSVRAPILDTLAWGNYRLQRRPEACRYIQEAADVLGPEELSNNPLIWGHYRTISGDCSHEQAESEDERRE